MGSHVDARSRRGSAATALLLALAVLLSAGAVYVFFAGDAEGAGARSIAPEPTTTAVAERDAASPLADVRRNPDGSLAQGPVSAGPIEFTDGSARHDFEKVFDGRGTIAVDLRLAPGVPFPAEWTLHCEPSPFAEGRDTAEPRTRTFLAGERSVEEIDLPMAAYRVFASAPGLLATPQDVVLHKLAGHEHLPGVNYVRVALTLQRAGVVYGAIARHTGAPAEELTVTLRELHGDRRLSATTDAQGGYRFADVPPGAWAILIGEADRPLLPPAQVDVTGGEQELPRLTLLELLDLEILAVDRLERPVPNAELSGYLRATGKGALRGRTDGVGRVLVRYLPAGPWRIDGRHEELDLEGRLDVELRLTGDGKDGAGPDGVQRLTIFLPPRPREQ